MRVTLITLIFLIVLILITRRIDIRFYISDTIKFRIDFTLLAIELSPDKKRKRRGGISARAVLSNLGAIRKAAGFLLSKTDVQVYSRNSAHIDSDSVSDSLRRATGLISLYAVIAYLKSSARSLTLDTQQTSDDETAHEIILSFRLCFLFISLLFFLYYKLKKLLKKEIKDV